jgi:SAM-dependent methyltransferase
MSFTYSGSELELFADATNWKAYSARHLSPYITGRVLEVGAGIGSNIRRLANCNVRDWLALEPDQKLSGEISKGLEQGILPPNCRLLAGTIDAVPPNEQFETILYVDVLEHIEDDRAEVARAAGLLAPGGRIIVLAPAHQFLYCPFDRSIGHFRRYNLTALRRLTPPGCQIVTAFMLDSVGFFASLANRLILRSAMPTKAQIATWDRAIIPISRLLDPMTGFRFGKSVIIIWQASTERSGFDRGAALTRDKSTVSSSG